jgi:methyltransferase (TIGR00027 family)
MDDQRTAAPDSTAVRVALWRAQHVEIDAQPSVLKDEIGLQLAAPDVNWRERPDMNPRAISGYRAAIVGRARLIEDLVVEQASQGVTQYVILGAGLDTFAQRRPEAASRMRIYEVDRPAAQAWKRQRLIECGYGVPQQLQLVPVDFEAGQSWWDQVTAAGFDASRPAVVASTGVSMYLTRESNIATLRQVAQLAHGSTFAMTFLLPLDLVDTEDRAQHQMVYQRAKAAGTPFVSFFSPAEMLSLAQAEGFRQCQHVSTRMMIDHYFANRSDGLRPSSGEEFLIATT